MNTRSKKSRTQSENVVNLDDDDDNDFHEIDNYTDNDDIDMKEEENEEEKEKEESTDLFKECMELLNPIFRSKKINKDQYVTVVNILKKPGRNRMAFTMSVEECRIEWLQSLFRKSM